MNLSNSVASRFLSQDLLSIAGVEDLDLFLNTQEDKGFFGPAIDYDIYTGIKYPLDMINGLEALSPNFVYDRDNAVKDVFDGLVEHLRIDTRWVSNLRRFVYGFATRDNDHAEFFGSPYLGTKRILFKTSDRVFFFTDIIDVDEVKLRDELIKTKWVNKDFIVSSDAFNLSITYLMHKVYISDLSQSMKHEALVNLIVLFHYRMMTSIMNHYFGYLVKPNVAITAYNKLSMKYDIKRYGSWTALFKARAEFIIDPKKGIHYETFTKYDDDKKIVYMVNDIASRLKGVVNDYTKVLYEIKDSVELVETESGLAVLDGEMNIKDVQKNVTKYKNYIANVIAGDGGFYKDALVGYAAKVIPRTPPDKLTMVIREFPAQYNHAKGDMYRQFIDDITTHLFEYLAANNIRQSDLKEVIYKMRGAYTSNKSTNPLLYRMRDIGDEIISVMTGIKTPIKITSIRTSFMLYVVLRTLTMDHFK